MHLHTKTRTIFEILSPYKTRLFNNFNYFNSQIVKTTASSLAQLLLSPTIFHKNCNQFNLMTTGVQTRIKCEWKRANRRVVQA